ncbi:MAG: TorF family putative porin [Paludibacter sp.]|nr:TorF family putative porin [Paludibacter sp.]
MKKMKIWAIAMIALVTTTGMNAQEFEVGADVVSSYVWRGTQFSGASVQPGITFSAGNFSVGAWGSAGFDGFMEADLFASYAFDFGLTLGVTDYYFPGTDYFDLSKATGAHGFELNLGYGIKDFSIAANYMLNEAGVALTAGGDMYFELGYAFKSFSIFAGAGNGWHTPDGSFGLVNVGLSTSKDIQITETFTLPLSGSVILNPTTKQFFVVASITL